MKVEIFDENSEFDGAYGFEKRINKFIQDKKVIDIKYQSNCSGFADSGVHSTDYERSALIMYEDNEETANKPVVEKLKEEKAETNPRKELENLAKAYFVGYEIKEQYYYIKLKGFVRGGLYLTINNLTDECYFSSKLNEYNVTQKFNQSEIDAIQADPRAKGLILNKLRVPVEELEGERK